MNKTTLVCATLICLYGQAYAQDAQPAKAAVKTAKPVAVTKIAQPAVAKPVAVTKPVAKTAQPAVASKPVIAAKSQATKSAAKSATGAVKPVAKAKSHKKLASPSQAKAAKPAVAAQPAANPYLPTRPANPYLANVPAKAEAANPAVAAQPAVNPYLANVPAKSVFASNNPYLTPAVTNTGSKDASAPKTSASKNSSLKNKVAAQTLTNRQISFGAMPMKIYLASGAKPIVAITLPCSAVEKSWNWFPPFTIGERMMFGMVGNVNEADFLPMKIEPVCT